MIKKPDWYPAIFWNRSCKHTYGGRKFSIAYLRGTDYYTFAPMKNNNVFITGGDTINPYKRGSRNFNDFRRGFIETMREEESINRTEALCS